MSILYAGKVRFRWHSDEDKARITEFLKAKRGRPYCDECLRMTMRLIRSQMTKRDMHANAAAEGLRASAACALLAINLAS